MKYKLAGGNVAVADYDICTRILREDGLSVSEAIRNLFSYIARTGEVPAAVHAGETDAVSRRMTAFQEINALVEATPRIHWDDESHDGVRDILESRYV